MTGRRQARPWRATVDSLPASPSFASRRPTAAHFEVGPSPGSGTLDGLTGTEYRCRLAAVSSPGGRPKIESP